MHRLSDHRIVTAHHAAISAATYTRQSVFNIRILDASIRDVVARLSDEQKAEVLLSAARLLTPGEFGARTLIENAVTSCLQVPGLSPTNEAQARLLRVKTRLANGQHQGVHQELQTVLALDPNHPDAKALLFRGRCDTPITQNLNFTSKSGPRFSAEVWRLILTRLPRKDLQSVLAVPHTISRLASRLLFSEIDLYLTATTSSGEADGLTDEDDELNRWRAQRCADLLTKLIVDSEFAAGVKTLRVYAGGDDGMTFQMGMIANALPKLTSLRNILVQARSSDLRAISRILERSSAARNIKGLAFLPTDGPSELVSPKLTHLTSLAVSLSSSRTTLPTGLLSQNAASLRSVYLSGSSIPLPIASLPLTHLTSFAFTGALSDASTLSALLSGAHRLSHLSLHLTGLPAPLSAVFRGHAHTLPHLARFAFTVSAPAPSPDAALFPAVADFLRTRAPLAHLHLTGPRALGFDAAVWGVLPSLPALRSLRITLPESVAPALATWLIPRGIRALTLEDYPARDAVSFAQQLSSGVPPTLRYVCLDSAAPEQVGALVAHGFPSVRVFASAQHTWTVHSSPNSPTIANARVNGKTKKAVADGTSGIELEMWPERRMRSATSRREWLEWLGCQDAVWPGVEDFGG